MASVSLLLFLAASANFAAAKDGILDLSLRGLTTLDSAFSSSSNLSVDTTSVTVNLSGNAITSWGTRPFRTFRNVTVLDLSCNQLTLVDTAALADVPRVRELNLSDNAVESLAGRPFRNLVELVHLDLSGNKLRTLDGSSLGDLVALQRLSLRGNELVALEDADLRGLARLQWLDVSNNAIHSAAAGALRGLNGLGELSAGDNPDVGSIVVVGRRLLRVSMPRAGLKSVPASLTRSVRTLILWGNRLTAIASGDLDSYPLLRELDLSLNRLDTVEDDAFGRLEQLAILRLSGNRLRVVPPGLPAGLVSLDLDNNYIESLTTSDFQGLGHLEKLSLDKNRVRELPAGVFRPLVSLDTLDLSHNPLVALHADALEGLSLLRVLHLRGLSKLESPASWLPFPVASERLAYLDVSDSPVLAFQLLSDTAALTAMRQLAELRMDNCKLTTLRPDLPSLLIRIQRLHLSGNLWDCDKSPLVWLPTWIITLEVDNSRCTKPSRLREGSQSSLSSALGSTSSVKLNSELNTTPGSTPRRYPPISTVLPPTLAVHSSSVPTEITPPRQSSSSVQREVTTQAALTSSQPNLTAVASSASHPSTSKSASTTPSAPTISRNSSTVYRISHDPTPEKSKRGGNLTSREGQVPSWPKPSREAPKMQIPSDKTSTIHLTSPSTQVRVKYLGAPQQAAINYSAWTTTTGSSPVANDGLSLMTEADEAPSISSQAQSPSTTSSTTHQNSTRVPSPDPHSADTTHSRIPLPSREALTAERLSTPSSSTSSLLAMFGVGAVGSALVLLVLAAAHAAPKPRLDLVNFDHSRSASREDDDEAREELW